MEIYEKPIFFKKNRVYRVYEGGKLLGDFVGDGSVDGNYPEEWIASEVKAVSVDGESDKAGVSIIEDSDIYLDDFIAQYSQFVLGNKKELGILVKFLDSAIRLPVQAHPDKAYSRKYFSSNHGKEECWIIIAKRPGGCIYFGFKENVTKEAFSDAIEKSMDNPAEIEKLVVRREVDVGDVVFVPSRTVHAIGAGCLILEVQEPTDFTIQPEYKCGNTRLTLNDMYLGLEKEVALDCFDYNCVSDIKVCPEIVKKENQLKIEALVNEKITDNFVINRIQIENGSYVPDKDAAVYVVISGSGKIMGESYFKDIKQGDYFLMPHAAVSKFEISGNMTFVECYAENADFQV